ncbi:MAG: HlyC/CorC family transporter, partial [Thermoanaerobaculia bacterium]|nr:HlyC/CorC family transporter [Thermoanaerobaculia bacterium]
MAWLEVVLVALLIVANGVFAMSEMAVVSSRKARLQQRANEGDVKARSALELAQSPDRFLSTVQIGITLVGILAGAFGGARIADNLAARFAAVPALEPYAGAMGLGVVVLVITYLQLVFGELIPKRLALGSPERIAAAIAGPMRSLSKLAAPFVHLLSASTTGVFKLLGIRQPEEAPVSEEEIKVLLEQGKAAGVFEPTEHAMIERVFRLGDRRVSDLMTPRPDVVWLDLDEPETELRRLVTESHLSRFPVCRGSLDEVVGVVKAKEYLAGKLADPAAPIETFLKRPLFVPETASALRTLETFRKSHFHLAVVVDEYGSVEGVVTTNDVLEAVAGELAAQPSTDEPWLVAR